MIALGRTRNSEARRNRAGLAVNFEVFYSLEKDSSLKSAKCITFLSCEAHLWACKLDFAHRNSIVLKSGYTLSPFLSL